MCSNDLFNWHSDLRTTGIYFYLLGGQIEGDMNSISGVFSKSHTQTPHPENKKGSNQDD